MDEETYKIIFARSPTPTLYVVSRKVALANTAAEKLLKRLGLPVTESAAFGKLWPKGTTVTRKGGLTGLKALKRGEYEVTLPDGAVLAIEVTALPGKRPARAVVTLEDVTENMSKENVLRESEERYRLLLDTMNDGFGIQDEDGVIAYVNDRLCDMLGYSRKELIGRPATELMDDVNKGILIEQTAKREKERGEYYELVFMSKEGKEIHTMVYPAVIRDVGGNYIGSSAVITDITKRKQTEDALRESEEKLRAQYKSIPIPTYTWQRVGDDFVLINYNDAAEAITHGNVSDFVGMTATEMYRDTPEIIEEISRCFTEKTPIEREMVYRFKVTDESKHLAVKYAFVPPDLVLVHTEDITDRRRSEEALKESEENYRTLHANIPVGVFRTTADRKGRLLSGNTALAEMFGFETPDEIIGINVSEYYYDPKDRGGLVKTVRSVGTISDYEVRLKRSDGTLFWVSINARAVKRPDGGIAYIDGTIEEITERKSVEDALKESEVQYRSTIDSMNDAVHVVDSDLCFVLFNSVFKEWNERLGLGVDVIGKKVFEVFAFLPDKVRDEYNQVFLTGETLVTEEEIEIGGEVFITETRKIPIFENGDVVRVVTVVRDITDRNLTESALRESEEKYRNLIERSNDAVAIVQNGVIKFANERVTDIFGHPIEELIGKDFVDFIHPGEIDKLMDTYERRMSGEPIPSIYETVLKNREGESVYVEINAGVIQYEGKPADFAFVRDITERKAAEEALSLSESKYHDLYNNAPVPYFTIDIEGRIKRANKAAEYFTGYRLEELLEMKVSDLYAEESKGKAKRLFNKFKRGESWENEEMVYLRKDGQKAYGSLSVSPVKDENGRVIESRSVIIDITDKKTVELERNVVTDVNQVLAESLDTSATVSEVFNVLNRLFDFDRMSIAVLSDDGETFRVFEAAEKGKTPPEAREDGTVFPADGTALGECVSGKGIFIIDDLKSSNFVDIKELYKTGLRAVVLSPLVIGEKVLGAWNIGSKKKDAFAEIPFTVLEELSADLALWLEARLIYEKIASSEERYRTLQANLPVGVFRTSADPGGRLISLNPALARMFGYEAPEDMYDKRVADLYLNPEGREKFIETISSAGAITDYEVEFKRADGKSFWGSLSARAVEGADGRVAYFDGILEDITERKKAELALVDSEKKYKTLYETTRVLSVYADVDEVLESIGEQASILFEAHDCTIYTINRDEGVLVPRYSDSKDFRDEVMSFNVPIGLGIIGHVAETGEGIIVNYNDKDIGLTIPGTERRDEDAESVAAVPLKTKNKVAGVIILSRMGEKFYAGDLDALYAFSAQAAVAVERAELLEEVRASEETYRTTFESTGTAITLLDEDTTITFANKGFEVLAGCPREEVEGKKSWTEFVAPYELERMKEYHDERRRPGGEAPAEYEFDFLRPDDSIRRVFISIALVPGTKQSVGSLIDITELRRAEERYRTTVESTGTAMALVDEKGVVTFVNKEMEKLGGIAREDLENKVQWTDFVLPEDLADLRDYESELKQGREIPPQLEFRIVRPDGEIRHCLLNAALLPAAKAVVVSVLDITDRKHAEETVERERRAFAIVAEAAAQGEDIPDMCERVLTGLIDTLGFDFGSVRLYDEETRLLNPAAIVRAERDKGKLAPPHMMDDERYFGALIARTRKEIFAPDVAVHETSITHKERIEELDIKGIAGYPLIGTGGRLIGTMELAAHKVMNLGEAENAMIRTVVEMLTVAVERRLAELAVAESEEKYRALFEQAGDAVYLETLDGKILEVNQQACDMLGYTREELTEMTVADVTPPEISEILPDVSKELSENGFVQMEAMNVRKDGKNVPVELNARVIDVGGRKLVFAVVRDISVHMDLIQGLKKQANELMELKRAKDTLTDLVVHDIKNISSSMLVWLELLQDGVFGQMSNEQGETIARVIDNNVQLFDLSQELLDVARSEEGEIKLSKQPFLLDKSVTEVTEYYKPTAEKQSKTLELEVKDEPVLVFADEERIRRVVSNLIINALKFVEPNEGEVRVVVGKNPEKKAAVVSVSDNGRGIPEEYQEMIFEKFRQVELRDAGFKRGAGLGLTFCRMVVDEHGGETRVESDGEHGSTFIFTLPLYH